MTRKEELLEQGKKANTVFFKLKKTYKKSKKIIYLVYEGKYDLYYDNVVRNFLMYNHYDDWTTEVIIAGGRKYIVEAIQDITWKNISRNRVFMFIDRDLSDFTRETTPTGSNIYITSKYSLENELINEESCELLLRKYYSLEGISDDEMKTLVTLFNNAMSQLSETMTVTMCWIIHWLKSKKKPCLDNIRMKDIFKFRRDKLIVKKNDEQIIEYIHQKCNFAIEHNGVIDSIRDEFTRLNGDKKFIRGKYVCALFVMYVNFINENCHKILRSHTRTKTHITFSESNALAIIAGLPIYDVRLREFVENTFENNLKAQPEISESA